MRGKGERKSSVLVLSAVFIMIFLSVCERPERLLKFETLDTETADINYTSAILKGEVTDPGSSPIEQHGLLLSESSVPNLGQQNTLEKPLGTIRNKGVFQAQFTDLKVNFTYYYRAFTVVEGLPQLGAIKQFKTKDYSLPAVTAGTVTNISRTSASLPGEVSSDGGEPGTIRGLCWGSAANPTIENCIDTTVNGSGAGQFTGVMSGLAAGERYYARVYARNSKGTVYNSTDVIFKTHDVPEVTTASVTGVTSTGAVSGGTVVDDGEVQVTARGVCWSTSAGPTTALVTKTVDGSGKGTFVSNITGLTAGVTYYLKAYATNQYGTSYGEELSFTATSASLAPTAVTSAASQTGTTTATLNGSVNANNLSTVVSFEYGTTTSYGQTITATQSPVTGSSPVQVSAAVSGLSASTTYHFRIKAVSTGGTVYGDNATFTTSSSLSVTDFDGNTYAVIKVGSQDWLQQNLSVTHFSNGDAITNVSDNAVWGGLSSAAYSLYANNSANKPVYGVLYNFYAVRDVRNLCPTGWHVPTYDEMYLLNDIGSCGLKEAGTGHWNTFDPCATNSSGFTALPSGARQDDGTFNNLGTAFLMWSSTNNLGINMSYAGISGTLGLGFSNTGPKNGFSVRCVKGALALTEPAAASSLTSTSVTLNGKVNPNGLSTTVTFEYGTTTSYTSSIAAAQSPVTGTTPVSVSANISGLTTGTPFHYRVKAVNSWGTVYSEDMTFTTLVPPTIPSVSVSNITNNSALLAGVVNANNSSTTVTFEYGTSTSYGQSVVADQSPASGGASTSVSAAISGLAPGTLYHFRIKAQSVAGLTYSNDNTFTTAAALPTVNDYDGNSYNIVTIGTQEWMQRGLLVTHYSSGDAIPNITDNATWGGLTTGAYSWYNNDQTTHKETYGALYNWYVASDIRNVCPAGWHVPSDADWTALSTYLGGEAVAGGKLKETGLTHWSTPNTGATNVTGFTSLPAGERESDGNNFSALGYSNFLWSSTPWDTAYSWSRFIPHNQEYIFRSYYNNRYGYSIRCIKGAIPLLKTKPATAVDFTSAVLNGEVNPNGASASVTFEYGTSTSYGTSVTAAQSPATGSVPVNVSHNLTGLTPNTTYHYRVKAVNTGGTSYGANMTFTTPATVADVDGNAYNVVLIGNQLWISGNLRTERLNDNTIIPIVTDNATWTGLSTPAMCYYGNNKATYGPVYGAMYNWFAVNTGKLCPAGWHVPSDDEWTTMENYLIANGYNYDGSSSGNKIAKALSSTTLWNLSSVQGAPGNTDYPAKRNVTGWSALPGGYRYASSSTTNLGEFGRWKTSTPYLTAYSWIRQIGYDGVGLSRTYGDKTTGDYIKCIKD